MLSAVTGNRFFSPFWTVPGTTPGTKPGTVRCDCGQCEAVDLPRSVVEILYATEKFAPLSSAKYRMPEGSQPNVDGPVETFSFNPVDVLFVRGSKPGTLRLANGQGGDIPEADVIEAFKDVKLPPTAPQKIIHHLGDVTPPANPAACASYQVYTNYHSQFAAGQTCYRSTAAIPLGDPSTVPLGDSATPTKDNKLLLSLKAITHQDFPPEVRASNKTPDELAGKIAKMLHNRQFYGVKQLLRQLTPQERSDLFSLYPDLRMEIAECLENADRDIAQMLVDAAAEKNRDLRSKIDTYQAALKMICNSKDITELGINIQKIETALTALTEGITPIPGQVLRTWPRSFIDRLGYDRDDTIKACNKLDKSGQCGKQAQKAFESSIKHIHQVLSGKTMLALELRLYPLYPRLDYYEYWAPDSEYFNETNRLLSIIVSARQGSSNTATESNPLDTIANPKTEVAQALKQDDYSRAARAAARLLNPNKDLMSYTVVPAYGTYQSPGYERRLAWLFLRLEVAGPKDVDRIQQEIMKLAERRAGRVPIEAALICFQRALVNENFDAAHRLNEIYWTLRQNHLVPWRTMYEISGFFLVTEQLFDRYRAQEEHDKADRLVKELGFRKLQ